MEKNMATARERLEEVRANLSNLAAGATARPADPVADAARNAHWPGVAVTMMPTHTPPPAAPRPKVERPTVMPASQRVFELAPDPSLPDWRSVPRYLEVVKQRAELDQGQKDLQREAKELDRAITLAEVRLDQLRYPGMGQPSPDPSEVLEAHAHLASLRQRREEVDRALLQSYDSLKTVYAAQLAIEREEGRAVLDAVVPGLEKELQAFEKTMELAVRQHAGVMRKWLHLRQQFSGNTAMRPQPGRARFPEAGGVPMPTWGQHTLSAENLERWRSRVIKRLKDLKGKLVA